MIVLLTSCKSEEQRQYDELIDRSQTLYEKIKDRPDYLYLSNNYLDSKYMSILDEKMSIIYKSKELEDNSKIDAHQFLKYMNTIIDYLAILPSFFILPKKAIRFQTKIIIAIKLPNSFNCTKSVARIKINFLLFLI